MEKEWRVCGSCHGSMEEGFLIDTDRGGVKQERWIAGPPEASFWQLTKTSGKTCFLVATFRCAQCGLLTSYATVPTTPPSFLEP